MVACPIRGHETTTQTATLGFPDQVTFTARFPAAVPKLN